jgi:3-deoxy-D-manno-octulosonic-acid transferase
MKLARIAYNAALAGLMPYALLHPLWRSRRQPGYLEHFRERFGSYPDAGPTPLIWMHAVSVGETRAAEPLARVLLERHPGHRLLMTQMTPTGRATARALYDDRALVAYLPYDYPFAVGRFLDHFRPAVGVLMETEIWFNLIHACRDRGLPLYLANARLSERSCRRYARFPALVGEGLRSLAGIAAQSDADAERLRRLGAPSVVVTGSVKFDVPPPPEMLERGRALRASFGPVRPVLVAASTRDGEESLVLEAVAAMRVPDLLLVLIPRHPQRFDAVESLLRTLGIRYQRRTQGGSVAAATRVVLGDSMGELFAYYAAGDVAFVGGSLLPFGGQNLIEPMAVGLPVLIGPHMFNFADTAQHALSEGAAIAVANAGELAAAASRLLLDATAREACAAAGARFVAAHRGASRRTADLIRF